MPAISTTRFSCNSPQRPAVLVLRSERESLVVSDCSEALVVASVTELMRDRTTIVVAHRLSTVRQMDRVMVIEDGAVKEQGSPADLLHSQGYFARLAGAPGVRKD